ncbi:HIT-like domain-containing protein, partial [Geranomyces variabilis]
MPPGSQRRLSLALLSFLALALATFVAHPAKHIARVLPPALAEELSDLHVVHDLICTQVPMPPFWHRLCGCAPLSDSNESSPLADQNGYHAHANCIFCRIAAGREESARVVYQDDEFVAFHDINPSASLHLLVIPRAHVGTVKDLQVSSRPLVARMATLGRRLLAENGFPAAADQQLGFHVPPFTSVAHLHLHALGLPYKSWLRSKKYPESGGGSWGRWFVGVDKLISSLDRAADRGDFEGFWKWSWV